MATPYKSDVAEQEVPLHGELAEFRIALREEIDAARRAASSSAVPLVMVGGSRRTRSVTSTSSRSSPPSTFPTARRVTF
jgi:hypothetical protein